MRNHHTFPSPWGPQRILPALAHPPPSQPPPAPVSKRKPHLGLENSSRNGMHGVEVPWGSLTSFCFYLHAYTQRPLRKI